MSSAATLEVRDLHVRFPTRRDPFGRARAHYDAVRGVSFEVAGGECVGIVGESGSGKTTVGNAIVGLSDPSRGEIRYEGERLVALRRRSRETHRRIQMVFQDPQGSLDPRVRVWRTIAEGLAVAGEGVSLQRERAVAVASLVGLDEPLLERFPHALSGGQRQRVAIARALAVEPRLLILDEPTSALDVSVQAQVLNLLLELQVKFSLTYVLISHDISVIAHLCHRIVVMRNGAIVEQGSTAQMLTAPHDPYTRNLIDAVPVVGSLDDIVARER